VSSLPGKAANKGLKGLLTARSELAFLPIIGAAVLIMQFHITKQLSQFPADIIFVPLVATIGAAMAINACLALIFRDIEKSSVLTLGLLGFFFSFLIFEPFVSASVNLVVLLQCWWIFLIFASAILFIMKKRWANVGSALSTVLLTFALFQVFAVWAHETRGEYLTARFLQLKDKSADVSKDSLGIPKSKPDVYYVILDGCGSDQVLKSVFNDDQSSYTAELRKLGFIVPTNNHSNYSMTLFSLAATLNMEYINELSQIIGSNGVDFSVNNWLIRHNAVIRVFRKYGYKIVHVSSGFGPTWWNPVADENLHCGWFNECVFSVLQRSLLVITSYSDLLNGLRQVRLCGFDQLQASSKIKGPKFVFVHIILPHPPYLFGKDGQPIQKNTNMNFKVEDALDRTAYSDQANFAKNRLKQVIANILQNSSTPPVIVLQSDHGPATLGDLNSPDPKPDYIVERMGTFNALYLPGVPASEVPDDFTSVNTFRIVFNKCLGAHYPLLPNRSFMSTYSQPFNIKDVSAHVNGN